MAVLTNLCITIVVVSTFAAPCHYTHHCADCDRKMGDCLTECENGYYDRQCKSMCSRNCRNNTCVLSEHGSDNCTEGCVPGYYGIGCNIPCHSPGGSCTSCPGGCDGGYCQLGSYCVSGCVDSYYGTGCKTCSSGCTSCDGLTGKCNEKPGEDVGVLMGLSAALAAASVFIIVIVILAVCWCCRHVRRDRFQLYVTPTQDTQASPEAGDNPQCNFVDEARVYDGLTCDRIPACPSSSAYELNTSSKHITYLSPCRQLSQKQEQMFVTQC